jgi:hypothetical protein
VSEAQSELKIALGPVGALGIVLVVGGLLRRSPALVLTGAAAVWADVRVPTLRGFGAMRAGVP